MDRGRSGLSWFSCGFAAVFGVTLVGCGVSSPSYDVTVSLSEGLRRSTSIPTMEVDLVALGGAEAAALSSASVRAYFGASSEARNVLTTHGMVFGSRSAGPQTLSSEDPVWDVWHESEPDPEQLFVLVNLPGHADQPGEADPRRLILPLDRSRWDDDAIEVEIDRSGVRALTPMKPAGE